MILSGVYNWRTTPGTLGDWEDVRLHPALLYAHQTSDVDNLG